MILFTSGTEGMRKIVIVGISGTGKSALGCRLAEKTGLTLHHMDAIIWSPHWTETAVDPIRTALAKITTTESWIVEGWVDTYSKDFLQQSDVILYLDYPGWLAACGGVQRWWKYQGKKRPEMPEDCIEGFDLPSLQEMLLRKERPHIEAVLAEMPGLNIMRLRSRRKTDRMLSELVPRIAESIKRSGDHENGSVLAEQRAMEEN
jgi:adenylate kinase family enzyme